MKDLFELNVRLYRLCWETWEVQAAVWTTVAMRLPHMAEFVTHPGDAPSRETQKMVAEKVVAVAEGARDASIVTARLAGGPMGLRAIDLIRATAPGLGCAILMAGVVLMIDRLLPDVWGCELFAREPWQGREVWGKEAGKFEVAAR